ncbi:dTDP-4-dehydrorhamnose 3,5-epimerase [Azospirillum sp. TSO22-1]|uniref:dTDP-4-dehydrorhamnose 3,5-epimerase n=1 Tax=Azospirillum sp. TSO22-1 TaxID=716789 RepID=UPI000D60BDA7|nr:dTDP-4-dehydrorhamnose 3,5-epimerase [Azospirillum sp. TSO22-1]PWC35727.1 dTDP-4-dehydrorhamnose 3,5-epimerase [Azospirillum sp. TSO22-1]
MIVERLDIPDVVIFKPKRHGDARGFFSETYSRRTMEELGFDLDFVQDNHAFSATRGTVRGLHFQTGAWAQAKLLRVVRGAVLDVAVDIRRDSPTFGRHVAVEISADAWNQILVPVGFAHGYCTLREDTEVIYKVTTYYAPKHDEGILWNDPDLGIAWPVDAASANVSDKDRVQPRLADLPPRFTLAGPIL